MTGNDDQGRLGDALSYLSYNGHNGLSVADVSEKLEETKTTLARSKSATLPPDKHSRRRSPPRLPNELLEIIFHHVILRDKTMLHTLALLNRDWHASLNPLLYQCPSLEDRIQMYRFARTLSDEAAAADDEKDGDVQHAEAATPNKLASHVSDLSFGFRRRTHEASSYLDGTNADLACVVLDRCRRYGGRLRRGLFRAHGDGAFKSGLASVCLGTLKELTVAGLNEEALGAVIQALNVPHVPHIPDPTHPGQDQDGEPPAQVTRVCMSGDVVRSMGVRIEERRLRSGEVVCNLEDDTQLRRLHITSISEDIFKHMRVPVSNLTHLVLSLPSTKGIYAPPGQPGTSVSSGSNNNNNNNHTQQQQQSQAQQTTSLPQYHHHHLPSTRLLSRFLILQTLGPRIRPTREVIEGEVAALRAHTSVELERTMAGNRIFLQFRRLERLVIVAEASLLRYIMTELAPLDDERLRFRVAKDVKGDRIWQGPLSCDDLEAGVAAEWDRASIPASPSERGRRKRRGARDGEVEDEDLEAPWKDEEEDLLGATNANIAELSRRIDARGSGQPDFWSMGGSALGYGGW